MCLIAQNISFPKKKQILTASDTGRLSCTYGYHKKEGKNMLMPLLFWKGRPCSIYNKYMLTRANKTAGNKDKAMLSYKQVAAHYFNDVGNALVRIEVNKKLANT